MEHEAQRILRFVILAMIVVAGAHSIVCRAADLEQYSRRLELKSLKTHSRLIFPVDDGVETKWQEREGGFEISFRGAALSDLGDISAIRDLNDNRLAELRFEEDTFGLLVRGKWKFPSGRTALANPVMEHFDYRETSTPSYVLDFWVKRGPTLIEARLAAQKASQLEAQKKSLAEAHVRSQRRLASDKAKEEAGNLGQLCGDQKSDNIYLPFLPVHKVVDLRRWFPISTPDWGFNYTESTSNKLARLALRLYRAGSLGLTIRVLDFIDEESPGTDSLIQDEMKLLRSSALFRLGHKDKSRQWLRQLMRGSGHVSAPVLQAGMFLAAEAFGNGVYLTALENFLWLVTQFPTHPNNWLFHLAAAECLYALKQTDRAAKEYQWVAQNGPDKEDRARGALRIGDIYMSRLEYERALGAYSQALSNFDIEAKNFASVHINRGEALYWLGQYDRAAEAFKRFAIEFPTDPAGWRATFRLAEIAEIKGTDNRGLIYETINRYPYSPGAILGRLKLLPCGDHGGFDVEGAERFFSTEALNFDGGGEVVVKHYADLRAISRLRTLMSMAENERAVDAAIEELKRAHSTSLAKPIITKVLRVVLRQSVLALLEQGKAYDALRFYQAKLQASPKIIEAVSASHESDYLLSLARAASDLGLGGVANGIIETVRSGRRAPAAEAPDASDLDLKLRNSERNFTEAKALWVNSGMSSSTRIRECLAEVVEESAFSFEKEILLGVMYEREGNYLAALTHGLRADILALGLKGETYDLGGLSYWLATLHAKAGNLTAAAKLYRELSQKMKNTDKAAKGLAPGRASRRAILGSPPSLSSMLLSEGELLTRLGRWGEAASVFAGAVDSGLGGNQARYEYATALLRADEKKNLQKARAVLETISKSETDDLWKKLASEVLAGQYAREGGK